MTLDGLKITMWDGAGRFYLKKHYVLECDNPHWLGDKAAEICELFGMEVDKRGGWFFDSCVVYPGVEVMFGLIEDRLSLQLEYRPGAEDELRQLLEEIVEGKQW